MLGGLDGWKERLLAGNDACERALMDMMGGILEKKLEVVGAEEQIKLPAWMEGNPKKFTKEQHLEIKAFDAMLKVPTTATWPKSKK